MASNDRDNDPGIVIKFHNWGILTGVGLGPVLMFAGFTYLSDPKEHDGNHAPQGEVNALRVELRNHTALAEVKRAALEKDVEQCLIEMHRINDEGPYRGNKDFARRLDEIEKKLK